MMEQITYLENILADIKRVKSLTKILDEHFSIKRYKDDRTLDWYSLQRLFEQYGDLNVIIENKITDIEQELGDVIEEIYSFERSPKHEK